MGAYLLIYIKGGGAMKIHIFLYIYFFIFNFFFRGTLAKISKTAQHACQHEKIELFYFSSLATLAKITFWVGTLANTKLFEEI